MRQPGSQDRNTETREYGGLLEWLVFVPGAIVLIYGLWLILAA